MRIAISLLVFIIYLLSFNLYVWNLINPDIYPEEKKLWYCYTTSLMLLFYTIDGWSGYEYYIHEQIARISIISVITNFALIILIHHGLLENPIPQLIFYNTAWLICAILIFISSWKNGLFKK